MSSDALVIEGILQTVNNSDVTSSDKSSLEHSSSI
jgi:hypothetical protein